MKNIGFKNGGNERIMKFYFSADGLTAHEQSVYDALIIQQTNGTITSGGLTILTALQKKKSEASDSSTKKGLTQDQINNILAALTGIVTVGSTIYTGTAEQRALKKKIEAHCGKRPHGLLGIKSKAKKDAIAKWKKCAENYIKTLGDTTNLGNFLDPDKDKDEDKDKKDEGTGIGTFGWVAISVVGVAALGGLGYWIYTIATKKKDAGK